ncbi:helix-turn-helix domain-containing protein [Oceanobacillus sp. J11TS1]|uniref:helix-turn-helix domain-containing protein n=1 Tax=Oceanobacillus sp. J11TS1 TaxID=2807191 RepID=UPI001B07B08F|nr:helix-turn-helix domain-containing protein [Oceanobacillus sp. J11TS1]GIO22466.1 hypothetical protein J11TS1_10470 [Oceanobacillus sp. J11TS1]
MPLDVRAIIKSEMFKQNVKQKDLAELLGISSAYLGEVLRGKKDGPKAQKHLEHICAILNIETR